MHLTSDTIYLSKLAAVYKRVLPDELCFNLATSKLYVYNKDMTSVKGRRVLVRLNYFKFCIVELIKIVFLYTTYYTALKNLY